MSLTVASKYGSVREQVQAFGRKAPATRGTPQLLIPTVAGAARRVNMADWYWREIKEGGFLHTYLMREKAKSGRALRCIARIMDGFTQNHRSDIRRLAAVPARLYHRWKAEDPHFWEDDENLRSFKRDNPDAAIYVGAKRVRGRRYQYGKVESRKQKAESEPGATA